MPSSRPIAVLFDLDGTLIDTIELIMTSMRHAFSTRVGRRPTDAEWVQGIGKPLRGQMRLWAESDEEAERLIAAYREYQTAHHDRLCRCYDEIPEALEALRGAGHPMAVVTSKGDHLAHRALAHVGLDRYIQLVIGCDSTTRHKPEPEPVLLALDRIGYRPEEAVYVGDSIWDVAAGRAAGTETVAVTWGAFTREQLEPSEPDHWLDRPAELPALIERLQARRRPPAEATTPAGA